MSHPGDPDTKVVGMGLNMHRVWIFLQVVDHGGFSAAATQLYMSQSSVSHQIRQLEGSLQATLVDRSGSRARPTAEGEALVDYARRIFLLADEAVTAIQRVQNLDAGQLDVSGTSTVGAYLLPSLVARFRQERPNLDYSIHTGNGEQVLRTVLSGEVGIAVFADWPDSERLTVEPIFTDRMTLIASAAHPLARGRIDPRELTGEHFLLREHGSATRRLQERAIAQWGLEHVAVSEVGGTETLKRSVAAGLGVSLISEHAVHGDAADGALATIEVNPAPPARPVVVGYRRDRLLSPAERAFLALLQQVREQCGTAGHAVCMGDSTCTAGCPTLR